VVNLTRILMRVGRKILREIAEKFG
jgi:hypothetical protein